MSESTRNTTPGGSGSVNGNTANSIGTSDITSSSTTPATTTTATTTADNPTTTTPTTTSSPRWRFDIDLNFDQQIAPTVNTMLSSLDDWMSRSPYNFRRQNSSSSTTPTTDNNSSADSGLHRTAASNLSYNHNNTSVPMGRLPSGSRSRPTSINNLNRSSSSMFPSSSSSNHHHHASEALSNTNNSVVNGESETNHVLPNYHSQTSSPSSSSIGGGTSNRSRMLYHNIDIESNNTGSTTNPTTTTHLASQQGTVVVDMEDNWSPSNVPPPPVQSSHGHHHHSQQQQQHHEHDEERGGRRTPGGEHTPTSGTTPAEIFRNSPEGQRIISVAERYSPFLLILLVKGLFDHGTGIVSFLICLLIFSHANSLFKKEVSKQGKRKLSCLLMIIANLIVCTGFILYLYQDDKLYLGLLFLPTNTNVASMWSMFWVTGVIDFIAKYITIVVKVFVLMSPARFCAYQKRGKYYLFVERTSQLYRSSIPVYPWVLYMSGKYEGPSAVIGGFLVLLYCALKLSEISKRYSAWHVSFVKLLQQVHYGETPSETDIKEAGDVCPICHDSFQQPIKLKCSHLFCEECVATWFDREKTCPLCRSVIGFDPTFRDGQTTQFIQIF